MKALPCWSMPRWEPTFMPRPLWLQWLTCSYVTGSPRRCASTAMCALSAARQAATSRRPWCASASVWESACWCVTHTIPSKWLCRTVSSHVSRRVLGRATSWNPARGTRGHSAVPAALQLESPASRTQLWQSPATGGFSEVTWSACCARSGGPRPLAAGQRWLAPGALGAPRRYRPRRSEELLRGPSLGWSTRGAAPVGGQARLAGRSRPSGDQDVATEGSVGEGFALRGVRAAHDGPSPCRASLAFCPRTPRSSGWICLLLGLRCEETAVVTRLGTHTATLAVAML